ncbi:diacylglycerol kinase [Aerophototrophica crusticola]|uniref:Diacylglycerol kinase n=1 Tax=Aerophototrophica crusticola TaxID=1709002 RepID=A0A858R579_9PROT|nr:diacylglycerol kinase [Rhodospirillaceae bacterium B3]
MVRLGLIRNPKSTRNKAAGSDARDRAAAMLGLYFAEPATPAELSDVLADFARDGVEIICVDGGDGTVREVLTALPQAYGDSLPQLSILASGKTNLIAADVGTPGPGLKGLARLVEGARKGTLGGHIRRRHALEVSWADGSQAPVLGMFAGAGAFTRGTELAQGYHAKGLTQGPAVIATMAGVLGRALVGNDRDGWLAGEPMSVVTPDCNGPAGSRFITLATTLHRLMLGLWPFWGEGDGSVRYLDVAANPAHLACALPRILRGKPTRWMKRDGYRSGVTDRLTWGLTRPFILDGEVYQPGPGGVVHLSSGPLIDFVVP